MKAEREPEAVRGGYLYIEPPLIEEATFLRMRNHPLESAFHAGRAALYEISDTEQREHRFRAFYSSWFQRLGLDDPVRVTLGEYPTVRSGTCACLICRAPTPRFEGADLHVARDRSPDGRLTDHTLIVRLCAQSFANPVLLVERLRHELLHISDMLDPGFDYRPDLALPDAAPAVRATCTERYRALWNVSVDGRLGRLGRRCVELEVAHRAEFNRVFAPPVEERAAIYQHVYDCERPTHHLLSGFALHAGSRVPLHALSPPASPAGRAGPARR